jgi:hypothetical protein
MTGVAAALVMPVPACWPLLRKLYCRRAARALPTAPFGCLSCDVSREAVK